MIVILVNVRIIVGVYVYLGGPISLTVQVIYFMGKIYQSLLGKIDTLILIHSYEKIVLFLEFVCKYDSHCGEDGTCNTETKKCDCLGELRFNGSQCVGKILPGQVLLIFGTLKIFTIFHQEKRVLLISKP